MCWVLHSFIYMYTLTHCPLISTPTIETALCSSEFVFSVQHQRRAVSGLKISDSTSIFIHQTFIHTALRMSLPILEIILGTLGFGVSIMFCLTFCRGCNSLREEQIEREVTRRTEQNGRARHSIYFIPFTGGLSQPDTDDHHRVPQQIQEHHSPPQYNTADYCEPPPSYNELVLKSEDLPPAYTEHHTPVYPITPPPHTDTSQTQSPQ
ncbi:uncharacterized protein LOC113139162 [Mastacembelus armatus]|uniref:uncharacterized protein LOC113139162 n=1 Tax=Mastacembelus armatus TaxID=205130 RepID=UPI000E45EC54|nr:uncharacterized protein LOC113139162 [Mastacembelus armatus]